MSTPQESNVPELTLRVILLGVVLSVVMGAANVYLGLKVGMTVSASIPAAVIGMLILRKFFRNGTILEANQVQTAASAGESLAAGIIFTVPAMVLVGVWSEFHWLTTTAIAFAGGVLGILFMIPMRKVFVVNADAELTYPEGVACAAVLEAGADGDEEDNNADAMSILRGGGLGLIMALGIKFLGIFQGALHAATAAGGRIFYFGGEVSPALFAVGFIVKLRIAVLIFIGGAIGWLIAIPLLGGTAEQLANPTDGAWGLWDAQIRYLGVGAMVVGGMDAIFKVRGGLVQAVRELRKRGAAVAASSRERDIGGGYITFFSIVATVIIATLYYHLTESVGMTVLTTVIMIIMAFFFTAVASYIVGLVGNSNSPVSGMTITAVLFTGGLLYLFGYTGIQGMAATLGVAAVVCCAACTSGDVCNDLKTGHLVGAAPYRQQIMQVIGVGVACLVMAPVLQLLHDQYVIGSKELAAPQAKLFASLASGFFGDGTIAWDMVKYGAGLGVLVLIADAFLKRSGSTFRAHLMPIAVGIYLPFELATPILAGGLIAHFLSKGQSDEEAEKTLRPGVLFSSGVIAGESLTGIALAGIAAAGTKKLDLGIDPTIVALATGIAVFATIWLFARNGRRKVA